MPWQQLQIEPTNDVRAIKRAYAKCIKSSRPDENPQDFQRLHQAYKKALLLAERHMPQTIQSSPVQMSVTELSPTRPEPANEEKPVFPPEQDTTDIEQSENDEKKSEVEISWSVDLQINPTHPIQSAAPIEAEEEGAPTPEATMAEMLAQCQTVLRQQQGPRQAKYWIFLTHTPHILEDQFNFELGQSLFRMLALHQQSNLAPLDVEVLRYLNAIFNWTGNRDQLIHVLGDEQANPLFSLLDSEDNQSRVKAVRGGNRIIPARNRKPPAADDGHYYYASYGARVLAFLMDIFFAYVTVSFVVIAPMKFLMTNPPISEDSAILLAPLLYLVMALLLESSTIQATPSKYLLGMKVVDKRNQRIDYFHGIARLLALCLTGVLFKVIFFVNAFLGGRLLHDRISDSFVICRK